MSAEDLKRLSTEEIEATLRGIVTDNDAQDAAIAKAANLCRAVRQMAGSKVVKSLLLADDFTLHCKANKEGTITLRANALSDNEVVRTGEVLQVAWDGGRCVATRRLA